MSLALNFERKCRTCGTDILELTCGIPIFGSGLQLDQKIHRYLGLNVTLYDDLPKFLCATCFIKVESIDKFAILAKKTEEAYLGWFKCIRANLAKHVSSIPPPLAPVQQIPNVPSLSATTSSVLNISPKIDFSVLKQTVDDQINQKNAPLGSALNPIRLIKPEISIVSYSDLKLGLLIKDQELLKLILKALRWAEHDQKATFEVLIQRLKNTTFREILSNPNLLKDSDLTQLLKSYIGQEAFNKFTGANSTSSNSSSTSIDLSNRGVTIKPIVHISPVKSESCQSSITCSKILSVQKKENLTINEDSVTQMEVGVDPSLFFDDDETTMKSKSDNVQKPENIVTIQLVPVNMADKKSEEKMIPAILKCDVRNNESHVCSSCAKSFNSVTELQNHMVINHITKQKEILPEESTDKKIIKIRVKKNKNKAQIETTKQPIPLIPTSIPLTIPPTTTITVIPAPSKPAESMLQNATASIPSKTSMQKPTEPPKVHTSKSKRKRETKWTLKIDASLAKRTRSQISLSKNSKLSCSVCRKRFTSKSKLATHMRTHGHKDEHSCEKCDRVFRTAANLAKHKELHGAEKFSCDRCRRIYSSNSALKAHKLVQHSDVRPHRCTVCEKTFKRAQDLKFHLNQHTGARPYKCPQCSKTFASSGNCFSHRKRMHAATLTEGEEKSNENSKSGKK